jgi:hypothetical protein
MKYAYRQLERIKDEYNPEFDMIPGGPHITWAELTNAEAILTLLDELKGLQVRIEMLEQKIKELS